MIKLIIRDNENVITEIKRHEKIAFLKIVLINIQLSR